MRPKLMWLFPLFLMIIGGLILTPKVAFAHGGHQAEHNHPYPTKKFSVHEGEEIYEENCAICHGVNGNGKGESATELDPPPTNFLDMKYMPMRSRVDHYESIWNGRDGTSMPPWKDTLTDEQMWDVIAYIEHLFNHKYDKSLEPMPDDSGHKKHAH